MLFDLIKLAKRWNVNPKKILHVGAHEGEELEQYRKLQFEKITWVEAQPNKVVFLKSKFNLEECEVIEAAVWDEVGVQQKLKVTSNSQSTSLLDLELHKYFYPSIIVESEIHVTTTTLDHLFPEQRFDFISLDIQGAELNALKGFSEGLKYATWIYTEVNKEELYSNCGLVHEIDDFLAHYGFKRVATRWTVFPWGDAFYCKSSSLGKRRITIKLLWSLHQSRYNIGLGILKAKNKLRRIAIS